MNVVPTLATKRIGLQLIRDTRKHGADATLRWFRQVDASQVPALVAMLAHEVVIKPNAAPTLKEQQAARGAARRARIAQEEAEWTQERARRAHARYIAGARDDDSRIGERIYQRRAAAANRAKRRKGTA